MTSGTPVAAYMPATPSGVSAAGFADMASLTFLPAAGAVWYEAAIHAATGDWRVAPDALALFAPCTLNAPADGCTELRQFTVDGVDQLAFAVPLSAFSYRDGQYAFKVRAVDANGVPGDWSDLSAAVTVGEPAVGEADWGGVVAALHVAPMRPGHRHGGDMDLPSIRRCQPTSSLLTCSPVQACPTRPPPWASAPGPMIAAWTCSSAPPGWRSRATASRCCRRTAPRCWTRWLWAPTRRAAAPPRRRRRSDRVHRAPAQHHDLPV